MSDEDRIIAPGILIIPEEIRYDMDKITTGVITGNSISSYFPTVTAARGGIKFYSYPEQPKPGPRWRFTKENE